VAPRARLVLATSQADRLGGNLAWIRDGMATRRAGTPVVVLARRQRAGPLGRLRAAIDLLVAGWHLATARVFVVDDHYPAMNLVRPRPGTWRIQTWHACGAFKRFGYDVADRSFGADPATLAAFPIHRNYDLCLVSAARFIPVYASAFHLPPDRFTARLGIPRTDRFFDTAGMAATADRVRTRYGIDPETTVVLYAPTFRGERTTAARSPDELDLGRLADRLGDRHVVLLRAHPFVAARQRIDRLERGRVIDASDHPDINELMLVSDVLVTDYSSAIYEYALLGRAIGFFAPDHAAYGAERGFYLDVPADLPGPLFETTDALADWLEAGRFDLGRIRDFAAASFDVADGRATDRLLAEVIEPLLDGHPPTVGAGSGPVS
jgi:CDP-ribitol ribitolphosphotransferase